MKFSIKDFYSKCDQIRRKLRMGGHQNGTSANKREGVQLLVILWERNKWMLPLKKLARVNSMWYFWFLIAETYLEPSGICTIELFEISKKAPS